MTWWGVGVAAAGVLANVLGNKKAVNAQEEAAKRANDLQLSMYQQQRDDQAPWREKGTWALGEIEKLMGKDGKGGDLTKQFKFEADPGFQFRFDEGMKALQRSASAKGSLGSGGTLKALTRYGQDYASGEYGKAFDRYMTQNTNRYNQLASLAGLGQTATNMTGQYGSNAANQVGQNYIGMGNANAASAVSNANAINSGINSGMTAWQYYNMMNQNKTPAPGGTGTSGSLQQLMGGGV